MIGIVKSTLALICLIMATIFSLQPQTVGASQIVTGTKDDLHFSMTIPHTTIVIGRSVAHTMTVTNIGPTTRYIKFMYFNWNYRFDVILYTLSNDELRAYSSDKIFNPAVFFMILLPGQSYTLVLNWDYYLYDSHTGEYTPPDPGFYHLRGLFRGRWDCVDIDDPAEYLDIWTDYMTIHLVSGPVGGIWVPVDKLGLLAPYTGLVSTVVVATVAAAIYAKRVKRRQKK